jgi:hypothetical protein
MNVSMLDVTSAVLSGLGALAAAIGFGRLFGSKTGRERIIAAGRAEERAKIASRERRQRALRAGSTAKADRHPTVHA